MGRKGKFTAKMTERDEVRFNSVRLGPVDRVNSAIPFV
jgi:hypothetical protein